MSKLYAHQVIGRDLLASSRALLLGDEMRLGKTVQAIHAAEYLYLEDGIDRVLVVAPAQARAVWADPDPAIGQVAKFASVLSHVREYKAGKQQGWTTGHRLTDVPPLSYVVTNYELARVPARLDKLLGIVTKRTVLVLDESIAVANPKTAQSKACVKLARRAGWVWLLNGTPSGDSPLAIFGQFFVLDPTVLGRYVSHFRASYAVMDPYGYRVGGRPVVVKKWINLDHLAKKTAPMILRRTMDQVFDLPPKLDPVVREVKLSPDTWRIYKEMKADALTWLDENKLATAYQAGVASMRLAQITSGYLGGVSCALCAGSGVEYAGARTDGVDQPCEICGGKALEGAQEIGREKLESVLTYVRERVAADPRWKGLIWTRFRPEALRLADALQDHADFECISVDLLIGGQDKFERACALRLLNPETALFGAAVLVGTEATGKYAHNFAAAADVIYVSNDWSLMTREQSEARVLGAGQTRSVLYTDLCAVGPKGEKTIDHIVVKALRAKRTLSDMTVGEWTAALEVE